MAILSFKDEDARLFFETGRLSRRVGWRDAATVAKRKLDMIHYAARLQDLKAPPGNRLEALSGDLAGFWSVRINERWRIIFRWQHNEGALDVSIVDYHA